MTLELSKAVSSTFIVCKSISNSFFLVTYSANKCASMSNFVTQIQIPVKLCDPSVDDHYHKMLWRWQPISKASLIMDQDIVTINHTVITVWSIIVLHKVTNVIWVCCCSSFRFLSKSKGQETNSNSSLLLHQRQASCKVQPQTVASLRPCCWNFSISYGNCVR